MLELVGETRGDYFHIECKRCKTAVTLTDLRWVGGVPQVKVACPSCHEKDDLKLWVPTWAGVFPPK